MNDDGFLNTGQYNPQQQQDTQPTNQQLGGIACRIKLVNYAIAPSLNRVSFLHAQKVGVLSASITIRSSKCPRFASSDFRTKLSFVTLAIFVPRKELGQHDRTSSGEPVVAVVLLRLFQLEEVNKSTCSIAGHFDTKSSWNDEVVTQLGSPTPRFERLLKSLERQPPLHGHG